MNTHDVIVRVNGLGKRFKLYDNPLDRLKDWASLGRSRRWNEYWALKDVSFEVRRGECFGVIGENGAGKSTLLKILTGAMYPTEGDVEVKGRVLSLLELGTGFSPDLTGRQNIHNSASLLGFPDDYINAERLRQIEEFADIGEYFDHPVRMYSSGMYVRLAFSMFMFMEPDVFIIDEALSVGDIFFSQKCFAKIRELMDAGVTFVFVSHDLNAMQSLAHRVMLVEKGRCAFIGEPQQAVERYSSMAGKAKSGKIAQERNPQTDSAKRAVSGGKFIMDPSDVLKHSVLNGKSRHGHGGAQITALRVTNSNGADTALVELGEAARFYFLVKAERELVDWRVGLSIFDRMGHLVFGKNTKQLGIALPNLAAGEEAVIGLVVPLNIQPGEYTFSVHCGEPAPGNINPNSGQVCDWHDSLGPISVHFDYVKSLIPFNGIASLHMEMLE